MTFLITFIILSIINVVFSTIRSIVTIKGGKTIASLISGGYFAFYNIMLVYTVADFPMWEKCIITFVCNVVGVFIVKILEEKLRKDRLWKIEATLNHADINPAEIKKHFELLDIGCYYVECGKYDIFHVFCPTQEESRTAKKILDTLGAKYFVTESKVL